MFEQISGNKVVPSKLASVSEVSDKKKPSSLPYILSQKYTPNPTAFLAPPNFPSAPRAFPARKVKTELKALALLEGVLPMSCKGPPQDRLMVGKQEEPGNGFSVGHFQPWAQTAEQDWHGTPDASCNLLSHSTDTAQIKPFFWKLKSSWLSWLVWPHSKKQHREVDLQKVCTRSQTSLSSHQANERPGPPAVPLRVTQGLHAELRQGSHFAEVRWEEGFGVFWINQQIWPTRFLCLKREKQHQTPADPIMRTVTTE